MVKFQRMSMGRDNFGVNFAYYEAVGLPVSVKCQVLPEEADRPRGEWYVACHGGTRKQIIRCKSRDEDVEKATDWCQRVAAKRKAAKR